MSGRTDLANGAISGEVILELAISRTLEGNGDGATALRLSVTAPQLGAVSGDLSLRRADVDRLSSIDLSHTAIDAIEGAGNPVGAGGDVGNAQWVG